MKKLFKTLLILSFVLCIGCGKTQTQLQMNPEKLLEYDFSYNDISDINKKLRNQKYSYTTNSNKKIISIITLDDGMAHVKEYEVYEDVIKDITVPKKQFIISIHANSTVLYTWNIKNSSDLRKNDIIAIKNKDNIQIPFKSNGADGESYDRENFLFDVKKKGTQKIIIRYEHSEEVRNTYFEMTLNLIVK